MEKLKKFLSLFGQPGLFMYPDAPDGAKPNGHDCSTYADLDTCHRVNGAMAYALAFRPAGNLAKKNAVGQRIVTSEPEDYLPAFWFDIDLDEKTAEDGITTIAELMQHVAETAGKHGLPLAFVTKTGRGVHCYFMVEESARAKVAKDYKAKLDGIQKNIAESFGYFDDNAIGIKRLMRLPFTKHWKTGLPIDVELYRADWGEDADYETPRLVKCEKPDDVRFDPRKSISLSTVEQFAQYASEKIAIDAGHDLKLRLEIASDMEKVDRVPMTDLLRKLEKYPRSHAGKLWRFKLARISGNTGFIDVETTDETTGEVETKKTEGYRLNVSGNFVNCFSSHAHPIEERPRGSAYPFLHHYFKGDLKQIRDFLLAEFGLNLHERRTDTVMVPLATSHGSVIFTKNEVVYKKQKVNKGGNITEQEVVLFRTPMKVVGVIETNHYRKGELAHPQSYYVIERLDRSGPDARFILEFVEDRKKFNRKYGQQQVIFHGDEEDLLDFYLAMNFAVRGGQVPAFKYEWQNGWRGDRFVIGKNIWSLTDGKMVPPAPDYHYANEDIPFSLAGKSETDGKTFMDLLVKNWGERVGIMAFTGFCVGFLSSEYWKFVSKAKAEFIVPGLFLTGVTKVGKSTLISSMKEGAGLTADARKISVRSTSLQPLKHMGTDPFVMHIEEFTGDIRSDKESIVRDIINRAKSGTGMITGDNIEYNYRASVVIDGERLPAQASVTNRCAMVPMFESERCGSQSTLASLRGISYFKDLMTKALEWRKRDPESKFLSAEAECFKEGFSDRKAMIAAYLLCVWRMLGLGDEKRFFAAAKENFGIGAQIDPNSDPLSAFLNDMLFAKRVQGTLQAVNDLITIRVSVPPDVAESKRVEIVGIIRQFPRNVQFAHNAVVITYDSKDDPKMHDRMRPILPLLRTGLF